MLTIDNALTVDETVTRGGQSYTASTTVHLHRPDGTHDIIQATVHVDSYVAQSWSAVKVLAADRTWTLLATGPRLNAQDALVLSPYNQRAQEDNVIWGSRAGEVAGELITKAIAILG